MNCIYVFGLHFLSEIRITHKHVSFLINDACNMTRFQFELSVWCNIALYYCVNGFGLCHVVLGGCQNWSLTRRGFAINLRFQYKNLIRIFHSNITLGTIWCFFTYIDVQCVLYFIFLIIATKIGYLHFNNYNFTQM